MTQQEQLPESRGALWSLILAITSIFAFGFLCIPAVILGHDAMSRMKRGEVSDSRRSFAVGGLIVGYVAVAMLAASIIMLSSAGL